MILEVRAVPPFYKNGFVVGCERTHEAVVIDPGDEADELLGAVRDRGVDVTHILLTHAHIDHITGVAQVKEALDAPVHLHREDLPLYDHALEQGRMFGIALRQPPPIDVFYDLTPISFGDYEVRVHHTPGHCPGGVCLEIGRRRQGEGGRGQGEGGRGQGEAGTAKGQAGSGTERHLFVGDTLFAGSIGRTDLYGGNYEVLMRSITEVLFPLGDAAMVHPGHGPDTTIGRERDTNPFVIEYLSKHTDTR